MPRLLRMHTAGAGYLVTSRVRGQAVLFTDDVDYHVYLKLLQDYRQRHGVKLLAYCLLPDQAQLFVEPVSESALSQMMHDLTTGYTRHANKRYGRSGALFQERYRAVVIEKATHLLPVTAGVHLAPKRAGRAETAASYPFSSAHTYLGSGDAPEGIAIDTAEVLDTTRAAGHASYADYLAIVTEEDLRLLEAQLQHPIVGSDAFESELRARMKRPASAAASGSLVSRVHEAPAPQPAVTAPARRRTGAIVVAGAALVLGGMVLGLSARMSGLEQTLRALAQENEAAFRSRVSLASAHPGSLDVSASLEGTAWEIRLAAINATASASTLHDHLTFADGRLVSTQQTQHQASDASYRLIMIPNGAVGWEAIQTEPSGAIVLWEGQWRQGTMRGRMTRQAPGRAPESYTFVGVANAGADNTRSNI